MSVNYTDPSTRWRLISAFAHPRTSDYFTLSQRRTHNNWRFADKRDLRAPRTYRRKLWPLVDDSGRGVAPTWWHLMYMAGSPTSSAPRRTRRRRNLARIDVASASWEARSKTQRRATASATANATPAPRRGWQFHHCRARCSVTGSCCS